MAPVSSPAHHPHLRVPLRLISPWILIVCFRHLIWSRRGFNAPGANLRSALRLLANRRSFTPVLFALPSPSYQVKRGKSMGTVIASPGQLSVSSPIIRSKSDPFKAPAEALKHLCQTSVHQAA